MNEADSPFKDDETEDTAEQGPPMSREIAEEIKIQADISGAGKPIARREASRQGFQPPKGPSMKDRIESSRVLSKESQEDEEPDESSS